MTDFPAAAGAASKGWTCPFCPLACDHAQVDSAAQALTLQGADCARASRALVQFSGEPSAARPEVDGIAVDLESAVAAAVRLLAASRQPLFGGLGTDVAGARALYPLACATGAICDPAHGDALMQGLRVLQDRGQFTTTFAELRTRADLIVFVGGLPTDIAPLIAQRCGIGDPQVPHRHVVVLGPAAGDEATLAGWAGPGVTVQALPLHGDLFDTVALLALEVAQPARDAVPAHLRALAARLHAASYAVIVGAPARWPSQAALLIETLNRVVARLNLTTRAAALWIGGGNGAGTVNQVFTWLSGLPLRSRAGPRGLEHEPFVFDSARLLADAAVDMLLWISSFDAGIAPPASDLSMVVLGHPALAAACRRPGRETVFIPVATPGIGAHGHLFRTDGSVLLPLVAVYPDRLPHVADVLARIQLSLRAAREARAA